MSNQAVKEGNGNAVAATTKNEQPTTQSATSTQEAVEVAKPMQIALFDVTIFGNHMADAKTMGLTPIVNREGLPVGGRWSPAKNLEIQQALGTKDKVAIRDAKEAEMKKAWKYVKAWLMLRGDDVGLLRMNQRLVGKGEEQTVQTTLTIKDIPSRAKQAMEKLAELYKIPVEDLAEHLEKLRAKQGKTVDVKATVTSTK
jgi:hypothetical protein